MIDVVRADITTLDPSAGSGQAADAIVNAANERMLGGIEHGGCLPRGARGGRRPGVGREPTPRLQGGAAGELDARLEAIRDGYAAE